MDYEETLAALLGFMNRRVSVAILLRGNPRLPALAMVEGTLVAVDDFADTGRELGLDLGGQDHMRLSFRRRVMEGVFVDRVRFRGAEWDENQPVPTLLIRMGDEVTLRLVDEDAEPKA